MLRRPPEVLRWVDAAVGLDAVCAIDAGPYAITAGGIRTRDYPTRAAAEADALALARAMSDKCALADLPVGGCKLVMMTPPPQLRERAFAALGERIAALAGRVRTAGDYGTTLADLQAVASRCDYVHLRIDELAASVARGLVRCVEACAAVKERQALTVLVQGAGAIGGAVAAALVAAGFEVSLCDVSADKASAVAAVTGAAVVPPEGALTRCVDVVCPCAVGGVVDVGVAESMQAWALVGAANNVLVDAESDGVLARRGILHVPDIIASAGAVIDGIGATVLGLADRGPLIDALGDTARIVIEQAAGAGMPAGAVARRLAEERLAAASARAPRS